ncbi:sensor domain-containing diguanylate cyclase [Pseudobacillus badius]|uniref:sensor domain-containing diguanylate cyclase n=1 Tax=Bacillus badius TaxID=1455 RepID=UPI0024A22DB4|nr:diguanylate cyclase [Bacillus badius]GLY08944.1 hypothetical protein Bbad01_01600 [Bacillus badius]
MSLRRKIILSFTVAVISGLGIVYLAVHLFIWNHFKSLENAQARENMQRVLHLLAKMEDHLAAGSFDYAEWDDTYKYVKSPNQAYEKSNLLDQTLFVNEFNVLIILNTDQKVVFKKAVRLDEKRRAVVSASLLEKLTTGPLSESVATRQSFSGLLQLREGSMLLSSHPIVKSDSTGPPAGTLIAGRYLDQQVMDQLQTDTLLPVELSNLKKMPVPPIEETGAPHSLKSAAIWTDMSQTDQYKVYAALPDLEGQTAAVLQIANDRQLYHNGQKRIFYVLVLIAAASFLLLRGTLFFVDRTVFRRLQRLMNHMIAIQESNDLSARFPVKGNDEISSLEREFNTMVESLDNYRQHITELAYKDSLTHLPNRTFFYSEVSRLLQKLEGSGQISALLFIDLDGFKEVNDTYGHDQGDLLLQKIAERIQKVIRPEDMVSRLGGDEFILFAAHVHGQDEAADLAGRICETITRPVDLHDVTATLSASVGISLFPKDGRHLDVLIKKADQAMYKAKKTGKNKLYMYNEKAAADEASRQ